MSQFQLSEPAERDLKRIAEYLCEHSLSTARKFRRKFIGRFELLAKFPLQNAVDPRLDGITRMALVKPYQIFYVPMDDGVEILRVIHSARDLQADLGND
ncbi:MAG: type II toxin-antitoxin system RelE/ParE family toxin [Planctomycetes bacterium]|nr:type II toxin-antitoxin system RelE/ParE family toxin [Planctomycetota bacterium]